LIIVNIYQQENITTNKEKGICTALRYKFNSWYTK